MKKILALLLVAGLCLALFAGCQTTTPPADETSKDEVVEVSEEAPPVEAPEVTLNVTTMYGEGDGNFENYNAIIEAYKAVAPNVTINRNDYHANEETRAAYNADWAAGNLPDVSFWFSGPSAAAMEGKVVSIDEIRAVDPEYCTDILPKYIDGVADLETGVAYAMPGTGFWEGLFVNEKLLEKYELTVPKTWDELINVCKVLKENGIVPIAQGMADEPHYLIEWMLVAGAGDEYRTIPKSAAEVPESWVTGLNGLKLLAEAGAFQDNEATLGHGDAVTMFTEGKSAMIVDGSWRYNILRFSEWDDEGNFVKNTESWGPEDVIDPAKQLSRFVTVVPMPTVPGGKGTAGQTVVGGASTGWYISTAAWEDADKQKAAIDFIKFMLNPENLMTLNTGVPTNGADVPDLTRPQTDAFAMLDAAEFVVAPINDRIKVEAWDALWKNASGILDSADAKDVLGTAFDLNK